MYHDEFILTFVKCEHFFKTYLYEKTTDSIFVLHGRNPQCHSTGVPHYKHRR